MGGMQFQLSPSKEIVERLENVETFKFEKMALTLQYHVNEIINT